jgi:acetyl-CoA C-acetyltransferase
MAAFAWLPAEAGAPMRDDPVVILAAQRTPIGAFMGQFKDTAAPQLGAAAISGALATARLPDTAVDEVLMGCCLMAGQGQAPARQAWLGAGGHVGAGATTLSKMCGSGMKAVMLGHDLLRADSAQVVMAGGLECMSRAPHLMPQARSGQRMGDLTLQDHMLHDGLQDAYDHQLMGVHAERMARQNGISRAEMDDWALTSVARAQAAVHEGSFTSEISPVHVKLGMGLQAVLQDETPLQCRPDKVARLKGAFAPDGLITAASSASISDGAAAMLLCRASEAHMRGLQPLARLVGHSTWAGPPGEFVTAPIGALQRLLDQLGWHASSIDLFELNEAFALVPLLAMRALGLPADRVNVRGGACALGHPIGATGARILVTLLHALRQRGLRRGVACLCIGGGEATAVGVELM